MLVGGVHPDRHLAGLIFWCDTGRYNYHTLYTYLHSWTSVTTQSLTNSSLALRGLRQNLIIAKKKVWFKLFRFVLTSFLRPCYI